MTDLKFTIRRIFKNKLGTVINTVGLTIGIFVSIILVNYVVQEYTYDHHHRKANRIYKLISKIEFSPEGINTFGITTGTAAGEFQENFPQVENTCRLYGPFDMEVDLQESRLNNNTVLFADYSFFEIFDFPGAHFKTFNSLNQAILSKEFADKLGVKDPIGTAFEIDGVPYMVSGIVEIPYYTMFQFDIVVPLLSDPFFKEIEDGGLEVETYVLLKNNSNNPSTLSLLAEHYNTLTKEAWELYESDHYFLPLKDIYLDTSVENKMGNGNSQLLLIILTISILVLGLALVNYINLQIANNHSRAAELKLKRIMGAGIGVLLKQSVIESFVIIGISGTVALLLLDIFYTSTASQLLGDHFLTMREWDLQFWMVYTLSLVIMGAIAGMIPALKLFKLQAMTQQKLKQKKLGAMTVALVIFQFFVTAALLTTILFVNRQVDFLRNQPTGYNASQVVSIDNLNDQHKERYQQIKTELERHAGIISVAGTQSAPGKGASGQSVHRVGQPVESEIDIAHIRTINGYAKTLDLEFISGGDFTVEKTGGEMQFILNETAAHKLFPGGMDPIDELIDMNGRVGKVTGVVKDFHYRSFRYHISPLAINIEEPHSLTLLIKIDPANVQQSLDKIESALSAVDPRYIFDYEFLDDQFDQTYKAEILAKTIITYATLVALSISIMGLLALSIFVINSKIKEIAIRKTLGGSPAHIFWKLSFQLISWIILGNLLSIPASYFIAASWVQGFIYQVDLNHLLWMSPVSTMVTLAVAMGVIMRKLYKTMVLNPVEFLRYE